MRAAEILASRILFWGGILSVVLMSLGVLGSWRVGGDVALGRPGTSEVPAVYTSIPQVAAALTRRPVEPLAIVAAGILLLLATPLVSLLAVVVVFVMGGDRRYAGVAMLLVCALLVSFLFVGRPR